MLFTGILTFSLFIFWIVRQFNNSSLIFDQLFVITTVTGVLVWYCLSAKFRIIMRTSITGQDIIIGVLASFLILTSTIVNIDRSRSFYIIAWVYENEVKQSNLQVDFTEVLSSEKKNSNGMSERLQEQIARGFIRNEGSMLKLTLKGAILYEISSGMASIFHLEGWFRNSR